MQLISRGLRQGVLKSLRSPLQHLHQVALLSAASWIGSNCVATLRSSFGSMWWIIFMLLASLYRLVDANTICMFRAMVVAIMVAYPGQKAALQPPIWSQRAAMRRHNPQIPGQRPPSSPRLWEPEGGHMSSFVAIIRRYRDKRAALQPHNGARERPGNMHRRQIRDLSRRAFAAVICPRRNADWGRFAASSGHERNAKSLGDAI